MAQSIGTFMTIFCNMPYRQHRWRHGISVSKHAAAIILRIKAAQIYQSGVSAAAAAQRRPSRSIVNWHLAAATKSGASSSLSAALAGAGETARHWRVSHNHGISIARRLIRHGISVAASWRLSRRSKINNRIGVNKRRHQRGIISGGASGGINRRRAAYHRAAARRLAAAIPVLSLWHRSENIWHQNALGVAIKAAAAARHHHRRASYQHQISAARS